MANVRRAIYIMSASNVTSMTGSIYKVCSNGATETVYSASFDWRDQAGLDPSLPKPYNLDLHYDNSAGDTCIEANFTYVSASIGTNVYYKKFGGQRWYSVGPGVPHNFDVNQ